MKTLQSPLFASQFKYPELRVVATNLVTPIK